MEKYCFVFLAVAMLVGVYAGPVMDTEPTEVPSTMSSTPTTVVPCSTLPSTTTEEPTPSTTENPTTKHHNNYHSKFINHDCNFAACKLPNCSCAADLPPSGLQPENIPQFVMVTFDGAVTVTNFPYYQTLFDYKNPNGCPIHSTYFVTHVDTNYKLVHELYRRGNEIGAHSISKSKNNHQRFWKELDFEGWRAEMGGQRRIISRYSEIPIEQIRGARAPNLQTAGNITFTALVEENFHYDCSNPSRKGIEAPLFPYTLDYGFQRMDDCQVQPCLKEGQNYPGFWDVPMNDWDVEYTLNGQPQRRECALASACILFNDDGSVIYHPTADQIYDLFETNFKRYYEGNRAPFPLFLSEEWMHDEHKREGLERFLQEKLKLKDVFLASIEEVLEWMRNPSTTEEYTEKTKNCPPIPETKCGLKPGQKIEDTTQFKRQCDYEKIGELGGLTKRMVICDDLHCPQHYPWINRDE